MRITVAIALLVICFSSTSSHAKFIAPPCDRAGPNASIPIGHKTFHYYHQGFSETEVYYNVEDPCGNVVDSYIITTRSYYQ